MLAKYAKHTVLPSSCAGTATRLGRVARAVAAPKLPITRRKASQISAASSDILSCPWPRTFDQDKVPPRLKGRGGITSTFAALRQIWTGRDRLPEEVKALAGGFTDSLPTACHIDGPSPEEEAHINGDIAELWRYQGFRL